MAYSAPVMWHRLKSLNQDLFMALGEIVDALSAVAESTGREAYKAECVTGGNVNGTIYSVSRQAYLPSLAEIHDAEEEVRALRQQYADA